MSPKLKSLTEEGEEWAKNLLRSFENMRMDAKNGFAPIQLLLCLEWLLSAGYIGLDGYIQTRAKIGMQSHDRSVG